VKLTNLNKLFWPKLMSQSATLIQYYLDVAPVLLPSPYRPRDGDEALPERRGQ
jgi:DNA primase